MVFTRQCALRHIERDIEILKVLERMTLTLHCHNCNFDWLYCYTDHDQSPDEAKKDFF